MKKKLITIVSLVVALLVFTACGLGAPPIQQWIDSEADPIVAEAFKDTEGVKYSIEQTGDTEVTVNFCFDGAAEVAVYAEDYSSARDTWNSLRDSMVSFTTSMKTNAHNYGIDTITVRVNLVNDKNNDLVLMSIVDDQVIYDCVVNE